MVVVVVVVAVVVVVVVAGWCGCGRGCRVCGCGNCLVTVSHIVCGIGGSGLLCRSLFQRLSRAEVASGWYLAPSRRFCANMSGIWLVVMYWWWRMWLIVL